VLCGGRREVVEEAHRACPRDGEIWLQYLVVRGRAPEATAEWALGEVRRAISDSLYPVATLVRGGEYLLGRGFTEAAAEAAREAVRQGQGFLPPYVLGIRAALARRDRQAALECAVAGADQAAEPWPFYRAVVALKGMDGQTDGDMIRALEGLQQQFPDDRVWSERLGDVYFRRGELQQALGILEGVIRRNGVGEVRLGSVLKAAEAARLEGDVAKAVRLLEDAHARHPDRLAILNNLVYYLAQDPKTVPRARKLLPGLLEKGGESYSVQDTAAVVALKAGDTAQAEAHMKRALELVKQGDYAWHEVYLNAVEMDLQMGKLDAAQRGIERVRRDPSRSPATEMRVRDLQRELTRRQRERTASRWWE
jgi:tetratricopeptide (TPR) repeat protein